MSPWMAAITEVEGLGRAMAKIICQLIRHKGLRRINRRHHVAMSRKKSALALEIPGSNLDNLGEGSSFPGDGVGSASRSLNTSGNNAQRGLSRPEASNSVQSVVEELWQELFGSFCKCFCCYRIASSSAGEGSPQYSLGTITQPPPTNLPNPNVVDGASSPLIRRVDNANVEIAPVELPTSAKRVEPLPNTIVANSASNDNGVKKAEENHYQGRLCDTAPIEGANFNIPTKTFAKAILGDKKQDFGVNFTLKITITESSHKIELSDIIVDGDIQHLIPNERYVLNNFLIMVDSKDDITFGNEEPKAGRRNYGTVIQTSNNHLIDWCHKIHDPTFEKDNLRYTLGTHRVECYWDDETEPKEYSIGIIFGMKSLAKCSSMRNFHNDHDLVNWVYIKVKNIRDHPKVNEKVKSSCLWNVSQGVERNTGGMANTPKSFLHSYSFSKCQDCCSFETGICIFRSSKEFAPDLFRKVTDNNRMNIVKTNTFSNGHALLIGTGTGPHQSTFNDTNWLHQALTKPSLCGYPRDQVKFLEGEKATRSLIIEELDALKQRSNDSSTVVISFSGDGHRRSLDGKVFLIPYGYQDSELHETHAIDVDFLFEKLNSLTTGRILLLLNVCYAGAVMPKLNDENVDSEETLDLDAKIIPFSKNQLRQGVVIISAVRPSQKAETAHPGNDHKTRYSPFTVGLQKVFSGNGKTEDDDGLIYTSDLIAACTAYDQAQYRVFGGIPFAVGCYRLVVARNFENVEIENSEVIYNTFNGPAFVEKGFIIPGTSMHGCNLAIYNF
ncbi:hypothetical protein BC938DRAFT_478218 [Jimgerdemannia flammicorona]|uniref:Peptidase C14 caspase domain-containing protein n=1 Tax=Jimgerdemannia flammicorona TaxID=994334 RepID=A0A433QN69_9FUNG|nr:hypothetical protein BC938DRAFT_478218 [Jimgerdemannia flammicorona]